MIELVGILPRRQVEIGLLSAAGLKTELIAKRMGVTKKTVNGEMNKMTHLFIIANDLNPRLAVTLWFYKNRAALLRYWEACEQGNGWKKHWAVCRQQVA